MKEKDRESERERRKWKDGEHTCLMWWTNANNSFSFLFIC